MIILSCNNINKSFGVESILEDISFSVNEGDKIGIVGVNGTGKTTLFKIITGIYGYDSGDIYTAKNCRLGYLEQNTNLYSDRTVYEEVLSVFSNLVQAEENLRKLEHEISEHSTTENTEELENMMNMYSKKLEEFEENNGYGYKSEVIGTLRGLGFRDDEMDKKVNVLSGGEKTRVLLGKLLLSKPSLLMLDEPTNHLDSESVEWLEAFLRAYNGTVMTISHDRYFLDQSVNRIFEISNRKLTTYNGNYTDYQKQSKIQKELEQKRYENQQREIKKQEESIERLKAYGREKHLKRARSKEKMLDKIDRLDRPDGDKKRAKFRFQRSHQSGRDVLQVEDISKSYNEKNIFKDVSFDIYRGEKVALIGPNGVGKSTLFKMIMGDEKKLTGEIHIGQNVEISYFHQEQKTLNLNNTIIDEIWDSNPKLNQTDVRNLLGAFLFYGEDVFKEIKTLSGGERARVAILKLMLSNSNLLLLDEPTNHLDIDSKEVLEEAIENYDGTVFTISHDRYFINKIADKILVLNKDGITEYLGNYDYYLEKKKQQQEMQKIADDNNVVGEKTKTKIKEERRKEKENKQKENERKRNLKNIENEITILEKQIAGLEYLLCDEEIYLFPEKIAEVGREKNEYQRKLNELYDKWERMIE
ncbi:ABC-F family ATP-binding cassette domain-containing protein [Peptostreptococcus anaerobius]|uniref:ABC-F family ATP-binding cassette domain-containing protein n=4 Tax=Peptostreptococcus porci TaxID=2652282 RepID=A0A6N7XCK1_9FIRM|nr:ABC-F family ATP-binding cassette domain-containing protein [Peptostreptococcus porci]MDY2795502.1 ABC-F family ATP-binding cassette domain-containing protein [Peptostreptococcus porci]MST62426.1 ABC-F family ATP-binding cassette domain-containing protein [Peptostreptococcus porci]